MSLKIKLRSSENISKIDFSFKSFARNQTLIIKLNISKHLDVLCLVASSFSLRARGHVSKHSSQMLLEGFSNN